MYAFSKFQFDQYIRQFRNKKSQIVSLRYLNVYGPNELHKKEMASIPFNLSNKSFKMESVNYLKVILVIKMGSNEQILFS